MSDSPSDLNSEGLDCAIRVGKLEDSSLIARKIGYLRNVVVRLARVPGTPSARRAASTTSRTTAASTTCIPTASRGNGSSTAPGGPHGGRHRRAHADQRRRIGAAGRGRGAGHHPGAAHAGRVHAGQGHAGDGDAGDASTGKPVWIVYPQRKHLSARVQVFIEWVRELFDRTNEPSVPKRASPRRRTRSEAGRSLISTPFTAIRPRRTSVTQAPPGISSSSATPSTMR